MGFIVAPSQFEIEHHAAIFAGQAYEAEHGVLPDAPMWRMLERRFELNPARFSFWHPNIAILIERQGSPSTPPACRAPHGWIGCMRRPPMPIIPSPLCEPPGVVCQPVPPHSGSQVVPEPAASTLLAIAFTASCLWWLWTKDRAD